MRAPILALVLCLVSCSKPAPPEPVRAAAKLAKEVHAPPMVDAGRPAWIPVTPNNVRGEGVPTDYILTVTGKRVVVWAEPGFAELPR